MTSIPNQTVNGVVHILEGVIRAALSVIISSVRKWCVIGLVGNELICHVMESGKFRNASRRLELTLSTLTIGHWPVVAHLPGLVDYFHLRRGIARY